MMNPCGNKGSCCKRCKRIVWCDGEKIAFTAITKCECPEFEDDGSNECSSCDLNRKDDV